MMGAVAFFIVVERKGLGMAQRRQGPNKVGFKGLIQPLADGIKLFIKEYNFPYGMTAWSYGFGPLLVFSCAFSLYLIYPVSFCSVQFDLGIWWFLCVSSFSVYGVIFTGWMSNSRYSVLGAMRAVAQSISYEVFMSAVLFSVLFLVGSYDLLDLKSAPYLGICLGWSSFLLWMVAVLAETNRAPFDFVEGESELVAGFMTEVGGVGFALLALGEYSNMVFMSTLTGVLFFSFFCQLGMAGYMFFPAWTVFFSYVFVWVRATVPRYRYDLLMSLCWSIMLPLSLGVMVLLLGLVS
uniref:NADH-ubiquinone oxidoreductase chain 1 n=1 Tax=Raeta sp. TaxID=3067663 RepID=A0AA49X759_9BIVA|nr:NADH dehydrogenase subunit 1 [Raeta sp.]